MLHSTTLHQTKTYVKPLVPPEESQTWIIPMSVALLVLWREWHKGSSLWRANTSEVLLWPQQCSGHQPGFGVLPLTEYHLLTAPHSPCAPGTKKISNTDTAGKDLQRRTHHCLWFCPWNTQQNLGTPNSLWWHLRLIWSTGNIMLNLVNTFNEEGKTLNPEINILKKALTFSQTLFSYLEFF